MELSDRDRSFVLDAIEDALHEIEALAYYETMADGHPGITQGVVDKLLSAKEIMS